MYSLLCVSMNMQHDDDPSRLQHVAINTTNTAVSTVFTFVVVRKHNWTSNFKIGSECCDHQAHWLPQMKYQDFNKGLFCCMSLSLSLSLSVSHISVGSLCRPANCFKNSDRPRWVLKLLQKQSWHTLTLQGKVHLRTGYEGPCGE
jgi:hypothetical protein